MGKARVTSKLEGEPELIRALERLTEAIGGAGLLAAADAGAERLAAGMERRAPYRTGRLAMNIENETLTSTARRAEKGVGPGRKAFHGMFQELGTAHHAAQPFMRPEFDESQEEVIGIVRESLHRRVIGAARG